MGKNGRYGHAFLDDEVAQIPLFATIYNREDIHYIDWLKNSFYPTHYELGELIAGLFGFDIKNPNQEENIFYINGVDIAGNDGHIKIIKDKKRERIEFIMQR